MGAFLHARWKQENVGSNHKQNRTNLLGGSSGYEVTTVVEGLGQLEAIQNLLVQHAQAAAATIA